MWWPRWLLLLLRYTLRLCHADLWGCTGCVSDSSSPSMSLIRLIIMRCLPWCMCLLLFYCRWFTSSGSGLFPGPVSPGAGGTFFCCCLFLWFVWLSVGLCGWGFGVFASRSGFYVYMSMLSVYVCWEGGYSACWLRRGRVYRAGPNRAHISDPHIPKAPLIASVCCSSWRSPSFISHGPISQVFSFRCPHLSPL